MEDNLNRDPEFKGSDKNSSREDPKQVGKQQQEKAREEKEEGNKNFDQVQRRRQASPRSYNESLESENIENQNTEAHREQTDREVGKMEEDQKGSKKGEKIGYDVSERQQRIDEGDRLNNNKNKS